MKIEITDELRALLSQIVEVNKSGAKWSEFESDDAFQSDSFCGGFDATEQAFCFSYYDHDGREFWFQLTLEDIGQVLSDEKTELSVRPNEK